MTTILITFTNVSWNKGAAAQVSTFVSELRKLNPELQFILLSHCYDLDSQPASTLGIKLAGCPGGGTTIFRLQSLRLLALQLRTILWFLIRKVGIDVRWLVNNSVSRAYAEASLVADFSGDSYRDPPGGISLAHNVSFVVARMLKKPVVLISQSIGPFSWYSRWLSRHVLNSTDLIYIREPRTAAILRDLRVTSRIALAPDIAFMLSRNDHEQLVRMHEKEGLSHEDSKRLLVGISTSHLMCRLHKNCRSYDYARSMVQIIKYLHDTLNATIVLIPHETKSHRDDRLVSEMLARQLQYPSWLKVIRGDYNPSELKTLIASLDMLLAARLHAGIAGLSSNVPTILLSWSHKYVGVLEEIGIPEYVWDGNTHDISALERLCDDVIENAHTIAKTLSRYNSRSRDRIRAQLEAVLGIVDRAPLSQDGVCVCPGSLKGADISAPSM